MVGTSSAFAAEKAPCGRLVRGSRYHEDDDSGMVFNDVSYDCGCRTIVHSSMTAAAAPGRSGTTAGYC